MCYSCGRCFLGGHGTRLRFSVFVFVSLLSFTSHSTTCSLPIASPTRRSCPSPRRVTTTLDFHFPPPFFSNSLWVSLSIHLFLASSRTLNRLFSYFRVMGDMDLELNGLQMMKWILVELGCFSFVWILFGWCLVFSLPLLVPWIACLLLQVYGWWGSWTQCLAMIKWFSWILVELGFLLFFLWILFEATSSRTSNRLFSYIRVMDDMDLELDVLQW